MSPLQGGPVAAGGHNNKVNVHRPRRQGLHVGWSQAVAYFADGVDGVDDGDGSVDCCG